MTTAPVLTETDARRLTTRIRDALALADDLLARAYAGRAWKALGHADFAAYCAAELPELRHLKLRKPERQARAVKLLQQGATERDIAAATGSSTGTAHNDVAALTRPVLKNEQAPEATAGGRTRADQVVELVGARGTAGMTVRELCRALKAHHGIASGALSRLHRQGRLRRTAVYRDGCAAYVALDRPDTGCPPGPAARPRA